MQIARERSDKNDSQWASWSTAFPAEVFYVVFDEAYLFF